jgi:hypothetical protein
MFGSMKKRFQVIYQGVGDERSTLLKVANEFRNRDMTKTVYHCGYNLNGLFCLGRNLNLKSVDWQADQHD